MPESRTTNALGDFLRARRELLQPSDVGLDPGPMRRVPGLRREEVADLACISPDYYLRIEQGRIHRPSEQVLLGLARALQLDDAGRRYLFRVARPRPVMRRVDADPPTVSDGVAQLLVQWSHTPAYVTDANQNVLAANPLIAAISPDGMMKPGSNLLLGAFDAYAAFLAEPIVDPEEAKRVVHEWETTLRDFTAPLRYYGRVDDPQLQEIVGALSSRYAVFRTIWAEHTVRPLMTGTKRAYVQPLGWIDFRWQTFEVPGASQFVTVLFGAAGSAAASAIAYLAAQSQATRSESDQDVRQPQAETLLANPLSLPRATSSDGVSSNSTSPSSPGAFKRL